ncbi:hypothetical protein NDU88_009940 [Pleurodeles waltl]|uniref:Uncharacterized protein n=1 Tax=Pleurodeles waltl TaxID=8319 RepID=A0AAV7S0F7_PLEWA|nr:hypothetical protein NDU88_009940 [Pleurodeles waltl]
MKSLKTGTEEIPSVAPCLLGLLLDASGKPAQCRAPEDDVPVRRIRNNRLVCSGMHALNSACLNNLPPHRHVVFRRAALGRFSGCIEEQSK